MPNQKLICPHCQQETPPKNSSLNDVRIQKHYRFKVDVLSSEQIKNDKIKWYCNDCMTSKKIIIANWKQQNTRGYLAFEWMPILYYVPRQICCKFCKTDFKFPAKAQQQWYEDYQILTDVSPKLCYPCRQKTRFIKSVNEELAPLLKVVKTNPNKAAFKRISELYLALGNTQKAAQYLARSKQF